MIPIADTIYEVIPFDAKGKSLVSKGLKTYVGGSSQAYDRGTALVERFDIIAGFALRRVRSDHNQDGEHEGD